MSTDDRVRALFPRLAELPTEGRAAFLDRHCGSDRALRQELESLLRFRDAAQASRLDDEAERAALQRNEPAGLDLEWIGPYRVVRRLGSGGMGTVYEAEQPAPRRRVAVKIPHPEIADNCAERLRREIEALARLGHSGIATIYEAGSFAAPWGEQPFCVLELIDGVRIDEYVRRRRLDASAVLDLFLRLCDAVHSAHEHGVIHRDLKPPNVLVDRHGQPKVLDFGIARISTADDATRLTATGAVIGTLAYMAPSSSARAVLRATYGPISTRSVSSSTSCCATSFPTTSKGRRRSRS